MFKQAQEMFLLFANNFFDLFVLSAPWLLFGFFMAAMIKALVNMEVMHRFLGGESVWVSIKAALIGAPLPLCSCGVVPAALGLRSAGASKNATVSFLVATPETGVDSVSFTYALMGPVMAIARPVSAILSATLAGVLVGKSQLKQKQSATEESGSTEMSCCASKSKAAPEAEVKPALTERLQQSLQFAFGKMLRDVINWLLVGLLIAASVQSFLPEDFFSILGDGFASMLLMAVIGIPMYVCATASTPIAAGFLMAGLSPGAVLVFMLVGPASNIGTLMIVKNELGGRALTAYLLGIVISAFACGLALNYLSQMYSWSFIGFVQYHQHDAKSLFELSAAALLALFLLRAFWVKSGWAAKLKAKKTQLMANETKQV